jgi:hypothetical protein
MNFAPKLRQRLFRYSRVRVSAFVGLLAVVLSLYRVSLVPPSLHARALEVAVASTSVLVDVKRSESINLAPNSDALTALSTQADLVGEMMVTDPVLTIIGRMVGIGPSQIQATEPVTSNVPRTEIEPNSGANAVALIAAPDRYKLQVQVDPAVPVLHIYAQAPSAPAAERLATASVQGLRAYLAQLSTSQTVSVDHQLRIIQLGAAHGGVVNSSASKEIALLAFLGAFAASMCAIVVGRRIRAGWQIAGMRTQAPR